MGNVSETNSANLDWPMVTMVVCTSSTLFHHLDTYVKKASYELKYSTIKTHRMPWS